MRSAIFLKDLLFSRGAKAWGISGTFTPWVHYSLFNRSLRRVFGSQSLAQSPNLAFATNVHNLNRGFNFSDFLVIPVFVVSEPNFVLQSPVLAPGSETFELVHIVLIQDMGDEVSSEDCIEYFNTKLLGPRLTNSMQQSLWQADNNSVCNYLFIFVGNRISLHHSVASPLVPGLMQLNIPHVHEKSQFVPFLN
jgi:hypothetical protein